jgi:hypothetical protein
MRFARPRRRPRAAAARFPPERVRTDRTGAPLRAHGARVSTVGRSRGGLGRDQLDAVTGRPEAVGGGVCGCSGGPAMSDGTGRARRPGRSPARGAARTRFGIATKAVIAPASRSPAQSSIAVRYAASSGGTRTSGRRSSDSITLGYRLRQPGRVQWRAGPATHGVVRWSSPEKPHGKSRGRFARAALLAMVLTTSGPTAGHPEATRRDREAHANVEQTRCAARETRPLFRG